MTVARGLRTTDKAVATVTRTTRKRKGADDSPQHDIGATVLSSLIPQISCAVTSLCVWDQQNIVI